MSKRVYTAVPMPRTRVNERDRWEQLAAAVLEMRLNIQTLDERCERLERRLVDLQPVTAEVVYASEPEAVLD